MDKDLKKATFLIMGFLALLFTLFTIMIIPRSEYIKEIEYKNKIIERELGKNFESYEDYLLYKIELGES